jgi:hypothetical protein
VHALGCGIATLWAAISRCGKSAALDDLLWDIDQALVKATRNQ